MSAKPTEVFCESAMRYSDKNRSTRFLPHELLQTKLMSNTDINFSHSHTYYHIVWSGSKRIREGLGIKPLFFMEDKWLMVVKPKANNYLYNFMHVVHV